MKPFAIILIILCVLALAGTGFLFMTANMEIIGFQCIAADAADQQEVFRGLKEGLSTGSFVGIQFSGEPQIGEAENYQFYTYTIRLRNDSFLSAEAVEIQITPMDKDVLQIGDTVRHDLAARSTGDFSATILTTKDMHNVREMKVTWYFWGLPFSATETFRQ